MKEYFCLGTYTEPILFGTGEVFQGKGKGVLICSFEDGRIETLSELLVRNPSFLCIDEAQKKIYTVNEMKEYMGEYGGGVTQIDYDEKGYMEISRTFNTRGTDPCHIIQSPVKDFLAVANFASGSLTVFPMDENGDVQENASLFQHQGNSSHPIRQKGPHAHSSIFAPDGQHMYVPDLGIDRLKAYTCLDGRVKGDAAADVEVPAGSGPRFGEFSKDGKHFYLINEIGSQVMHFKYEDGNMIPEEAVGTLPEEYEGDNICSDLHLTPDGRYLYASNRGHDSLVCYGIQKDGSLEFVERQSCGGKTPRNFAIDPAGEYLLAGNQDSDQIVVFRIMENGCLEKISACDFGSPVCIRFFCKTEF